MDIISKLKDELNTGKKYNYESIDNALKDFTSLYQTADKTLTEYIYNKLSNDLKKETDILKLDATTNEEKIIKYNEINTNIKNSFTNFMNVYLKNIVEKNKDISYEENKNYYCLHTLIFFISIYPIVQQLESINSSIKKDVIVEYYKLINVNKRGKILDTCDNFTIWNFDDLTENFDNYFMICNDDFINHIENNEKNKNKLKTKSDGQSGGGEDVKDEDYINKLKEYHQYFSDLKANQVDISSLKDLVYHYYEYENIGNTEQTQDNEHIKTLYKLLFNINNKQEYKRQSPYVQILLNNITTKLKNYENDPNCILRIIREEFLNTYGFNRIGNSFNSDELRVLNLQKNIETNLSSLIKSKKLKRRQYFIASSSPDIRDSIIYLLVDYYISEDGHYIATIYGVNPLTGKKEIIKSDLDGEYDEMKEFFTNCDYVRINNLEPTTPKGKRDNIMIGYYNYM